MSDKIINLNKARKAKARLHARRTADENAIRFGRTKAEKQKDALFTQQAKKHLDGHALDE